MGVLGCVLCFCDSLAGELIRNRVLRYDGGSGGTEVVLHQASVWFPLPACTGAFVAWDSGGGS